MWRSRRSSAAPPGFRSDRALQTRGEDARGAVRSAYSHRLRPRPEGDVYDVPAALRRDAGEGALNARDVLGKLENRLPVADGLLADMPKGSFTVISSRTNLDHVGGRRQDPHSAASRSRAPCRSQGREARRRWRVRRGRTKACIIMANWAHATEAGQGADGRIRPVNCLSFGCVLMTRLGKVAAFVRETYTETSRSDLCDDSCAQWYWDRAEPAAGIRRRRRSRKTRAWPLSREAPGELEQELEALPPEHRPTEPSTVACSSKTCSLILLSPPSCSSVFRLAGAMRRDPAKRGRARKRLQVSSGPRKKKNGKARWSREAERRPRRPGALLVKDKMSDATGRDDPPQADVLIQNADTEWRLDDVIINVVQALDGSSRITSKLARCSRLRHEPVRKIESLPFSTPKE